MKSKDRHEIKGLNDCIKTIYNKYGYMGYFKGLRALVLRDASSYGLYFVSFEYMRRELKAKGVENNLIIDFICGGLAGTISWFSIMPLDVIKSRIQANRHENVDFMKEFKSLSKISIIPFLKAATSKSSLRIKQEI